MKKIEQQTTSVSLLLAMTLLASGLEQANAATWTGASPGSQLWSDINNWDVLRVPTVSDNITFGQAGATNAPGAINNIIPSSIAVGTITYAAKVSAVSNFYQTTLINPGATLTITNLTVGIPDTLAEDNAFFYTMTGAGGSLVIGNMTTPIPNAGLFVTAGKQVAPITNHIASLDLSGLDNYSQGGGNVWVGFADTVNVTTDRPAGIVHLAKTNTIVIPVDVADAVLAVSPIRVGDERVNTPVRASALELGQVNIIDTPMMKIGGSRSLVTIGVGASMFFRPGLINPTLKLRGTNDTTRLGTMTIGDNIWQTAEVNNGAFGTVDLTGGTVDALVNSLYVGRGNSEASPGMVLSTSTGTLTWTAGTFDVSNLFIGFQTANNVATNTGTVNVNSNANLAAQNVTIGRDAGSSAGTAIGILNINGGTVAIAGSLAENNLTGGNGSSTINITNNGTLNLQPAGVTNPATATFDTLNFSSGSISSGVLALTNLNVLSPATAFSLNSGTTLNPGAVGSAGLLQVNGGLTLNGGALGFDVANVATLDQINVTGTLTIGGSTLVNINPLGVAAAGTYPLFTFGTLSGNATDLHPSGNITNSRYAVNFTSSAPNINMNISGSAGNLIWSGGNGGNTWDLKNTANWDAGVDQFFTYDSVTFDDSGNVSSPVNLIGALIPAAVNFAANSETYTLAGTGKITGTAALTLNGGGTVNILTTNDYSGGTVVNGGTLIVGDGATADGLLGPAGITNGSALVFNSASNQTVTSVISGSGTVNKRDPGVTTLSGANSFTGLLTIESGTLQLGNASALGASNLGTFFATINTGGTLALGGFAPVKSLNVSGPGVGGAGAIVNLGSSVFLRDVFMNGDTTFGGASGFTIQASTATSTDPALAANDFKITKVGTNQVKIGGIQPLPMALDLGEVDIQGGMFTLAGFLDMGDTSKTLRTRTNATLGVSITSNVLTKVFAFDDGGVLFQLGATSSTIDGSVTLAGTSVFDISAGDTLTVNCPVTGAALTKGIGSHLAGGASTGTGTLILSGANTLTGFRVETGTLILTNSATVTAPALVLAGGTLSAAGRTDGTLALTNSQSLNGAGTLVGIISSPSGTTVAPAATNGLLAVTGSLTLRGTTDMDLNRTAITITNSRITVSGVLDLGGALVLTTSGTNALQGGDTFKLFSAGTITNTFQSITFPTLGAGLVWTNLISSNGTVAVVATQPAQPPTLSVSVTGGGTSLSAAWPLVYTGFTLQTQTNAPGHGISTNWTTVSTVSNQIVLPIVHTNGSVFMRLIK